jgi:uncharacterized membrane protein YdbT with pleckstrin-like domain
MYCIKCGAQNLEEAVYCQKCGLVLRDEEETRIQSPAKSAEDDEEQIFSIRPTLLFVKIGYGVTVVCSFLLVILLNFFGSLIGFGIPAVLSVAAGLALLLIPAYFHVRQKMLLFTLTDSKVEIDEGLISKTTRNVPLRIIQDVTVTATFTQRLLGFGNVEIENANESDTSIVLKNINSPKKYAEILLKQMRKLGK